MIATARFRLAALATVLAVTGLLLLGALVTAAPGAPRASSGPASPELASAAVLDSTPAAPSAAATSSPTAVAASPSVTCPTPQNAPDWTSDNFFQDALVDFQVPGYSNLSGTNFYTVPCENTLPTYLSQFWMNVSTNVHLSEAYVTIWATTYPTPYDPLPGLADFTPGTPALLPMYIPPTAPNTASFNFNLFKYFYPGTTVDFNLTLESNETSPATITSTESSYREETPQGSGDNATWSFYVAAPWWTPTFSDDIAISTTPSILGLHAYDPNPSQQFFVQLQSRTPAGTLGPGIPEARLTFNLSGAFTGSFSLPFTPENTSIENLAAGIGPYPDTKVTFYVTAWLPWGTGALQGAIDTITSATYNFTWSSGGGWPAPSLGLAANAQLNASPDVLDPGMQLATGTPVNVTIHVPVPNETISSAVLRFNYTYAGGSSGGNLPMSLATYNTSYVVIPGLPANGNLTFSLIAKDVNGNPVASGTYSYSEAGSPRPALPAGENWIFVEGIDLATDALLPNATYTITNATWTGGGTTNPLGFGAISLASGAGYRLFGDGLYTVTLRDFGHTLSTQVTLSGSAPQVVRFALTPPGATVGGVATVPVSTIVLALIVGPLVMAAALVPLLIWYRERQAKAAAEQKRITL